MYKEERQVEWIKKIKKEIHLFPLSSLSTLPPRTKGK